MKRRVREKKTTRYWRLAGKRVIFKTKDFDPRNKSCKEITKEKYLRLKRKGYTVGSLKRLSTPGALWWIDYG